MSECVFCGSAGPMSREHVFAQWLNELFEGEGLVDYRRRTVTSEEDIKHERPGPLFDVVVKDVCEECNNGWMAHLEGEAKPILTPLVRGETRTLAATEQYAIAIWATKTMLALQGVNLGGLRAVSPTSYKWFAKHQMPLPGGHVWLIRYEGTDSEWPISVHQHGGVLFKEKEAGEESKEVALYIVVIAIGHFGVCLWGHEHPDGPITTAGSDGARLLIWPASGDSLRWPPPESFADAAALMELSRLGPDGPMDSSPLGE